MIMNLFYAPGLFFHDAKEEHGANQLNWRAKEDNPDRMREVLTAVMRHIEGMPEDKRSRMTEPVRMFVSAFSRVLEQQGLLEQYGDFVARIEGGRYA